MKASETREKIENAVRLGVIRHAGVALVADEGGAPSLNAFIVDAVLECLGEADPRAPDYSREGRQGRGTFFVNHNCYRCKDGTLPCVTKSGVCEYPHARND